MIVIPLLLLRLDNVIELKLESSNYQVITRSFYVKEKVKRIPEMDQRVEDGKDGPLVC